MSGVREIIARELRFSGRTASKIEQALTEAGFRFLGPDELDPVTVERCAQVVQARGPATQDMTSTMICEALDEAAAELRTLTGDKS